MSEVQTRGPEPTTPARRRSSTRRSTCGHHGHVHRDYVRPGVLKLRATVTIDGDVDDATRHETPETQDRPAGPVWY